MSYIGRLMTREASLMICLWRRKTELRRKVRRDLARSSDIGMMTKEFPLFTHSWQQSKEPRRKIRREGSSSASLSSLSSSDPPIASMFSRSQVGYLLPISYIFRSFWSQKNVFFNSLASSFLCKALPLFASFAPFG